MTAVGAILITSDLSHATALEMVCGVLLWVGFIGAFVGGMATLADALRRNPAEGILILFVPFFALYYAVFRLGGRQKRFVLTLLFCGVSLSLLSYGLLESLHV